MLKESATLNAALTAAFLKCSKESSFNLEELSKSIQRVIFGEQLESGDLKCELI